MQPGADLGSLLWRRRRPSRRGMPTYDFANFSKQIHAIENILGRRGGQASGTSPLDPSLATLLEHLLRVFVMVILILIVARICRINNIKLGEKDKGLKHL